MALTPHPPPMRHAASASAPQFSIRAWLSRMLRPSSLPRRMMSSPMAAYISYPQDLSDHSFSVYVNRPGLSFGYFFRGGGTLSGIQRGIVEFTVEGYNERAFISMNQQQVQQLEIDDGNTIQVVDIDRNKPFAIVLPINAGNITFYDVNRNTVEYWNNPL